MDELKKDVKEIVDHGIKHGLKDAAMKEQKKHSEFQKSNAEMAKKARIIK